MTKQGSNPAETPEPKRRRRRKRRVHLGACRLDLTTRPFNRRPVAYYVYLLVDIVSKVRNLFCPYYDLCLTEAEWVERRGTVEGFVTWACAATCPYRRTRSPPVCVWTMKKENYKWVYPGTFAPGEVETISARTQGGARDRPAQRQRSRGVDPTKREVQASSKAQTALTDDDHVGKQREKNGARLTGGHA